MLILNLIMSKFEENRKFTQRVFVYFSRLRNFCSKLSCFRVRIQNLHIFRVEIWLIFFHVDNLVFFCFHLVIQFDNNCNLCTLFEANQVWFFSLINVDNSSNRNPYFFYVIPKIVLLNRWLSDSVIFDHQ